VKGTEETSAGDLCRCRCLPPLADFPMTVGLCKGGVNGSFPLETPILQVYKTRETPVRGGGLRRPAVSGISANAAFQERMRNRQRPVRKRIGRGSAAGTAKWRISRDKMLISGIVERSAREGTGSLFKSESKKRVAVERKFRKRLGQTKTVFEFLGRGFCFDLQG